MSYSSAYPLPPCICRELSAHDQAILAHNSLAMPASKSHLKPRSLFFAAKYVSCLPKAISIIIIAILL